MSRLALEAKAAAQHAEDARSCKVCMDREIDTVFIPCGHLCTCAVCYEINALTECPLCRRGIQRAQHRPLQGQKPRQQPAPATR